MNELDVDALEFVLIYLFENRRPDILSLYSVLRNNADCYMTQVMIDDRIKEFNTAKNNMIQEDVLSYLHKTFKELVVYKNWFSVSQIKLIESYYVLIDYYFTEIQKHGELSGV